MARSPAETSAMRGMPMFRGLTGTDLELIGSTGAREVYAAGQEIHPAFSDAPDVLLLEGGGASVACELPGGRAAEVRKLGAGDLMDFGILPSALAPWCHVVATVDQTVGLHIPAEAIYPAMLATSEGAGALDQWRQQVLRGVATTLGEFLCYDALRRLEHLLAQAASEHPEQVVMLTHRDLGRRTGIHREDVSKFLSRLRSLGLVDYSPYRRGIRVLDPGRLASDK
ncbi:MAG: Crp/Fnr family transcriptional regulator [Chloroflexota bacterium]